jgi:hypothetical protein
VVQRASRERLRAPWSPWATPRPGVATRPSARGSEQAVLGGSKNATGREPASGANSLLYGAGLRLLECCTLRVQDVDLERREITVRSGKGGKDRRTMVPVQLVPTLRSQLKAVHRRYEQDIPARIRIEVPNALRQKYPNAELDWHWRWLFPATRTYVASHNGLTYRHHLHESVISVPSSWRSCARNSTSAHRVTPSATASQPTSSSADTISAQSRSSSAIATWPRLRSTPTCSTAGPPPWAARWTD